MQRQTPTDCNKRLQHMQRRTATHCIARLQYTASQDYNAMHRKTATHCNKRLQHAATKDCNTLHRKAATLCNTHQTISNNLLMPMLTSQTPPLSISFSSFVDEGGRVLPRLSQTLEFGAKGNVDYRYSTSYNPPTSLPAQHVTTPQQPYPPNKLLGSRFSTPYTPFVWICTISSELTCISHLYPFE